MFPIIGMMILSVLILHGSSEVDAVGQPMISISINMDYEGMDPEDPIDISTGIVGYDPFQEPTQPVMVVVEGTLIVTSQFPHIVQRIVIELESSIYNEKYDHIEVEYYFLPDSIVVSDLMPGETVSVNFTLTLVIDNSVPAGENSILIGGRWYHQPGPTGGNIDPYWAPIHISPVISASFDEVSFDTVEMYPREEEWRWIPIINTGNVREPSLAVEIDGITEAARNGIVVLGTIETESLDPDDDHHFFLELYMETINSPGNTGYGFEVTLIDDLNGTEFDSFEFSIEILEEDEEPPVGDDDDDDPWWWDDDDVEEPIELLTFEQCKRTYTDAHGDDLEYWADDQGDAGVSKGVKSDVDINQVTARREGDDLVITVTTYDIIDEWTTVAIYILPDDTYQQPSMNVDPRTGDDIPDYEPEDYIDSTLYNWWVDEETSGKSHITIWSLESLMEEGLTEDFEIFVRVSTFDADIQGPILDPDYVVAYYNVDYAGSGAWEVGEVDGSSPNFDQDSIFKKLLIPIVVIVVVLLFVIIGSIYFVISRRQKRILN